MYSMSDIRNQKLASVVVRNSLEIKEGERVLIHVHGITAEPLLRSMIKAVKEVGAFPFYKIETDSIRREWIQGADRKMFTTAAEIDSFQMKHMDAYIIIRAVENALELSDVNPDDYKDYQSLCYAPVHAIRLSRTRWIVLRYPTQAFAQLARMSTEQFENWYYKVCLVDYRQMRKAMEPLRLLMEKTEQVRILGPGETDLSFSIKNIPVVPCSGECNIPDGEIYTAPVRDSVNGVIAYNTPSIQNSFEFNTIRFRFKNGRIEEASANDTERLNTILDTDEGARYIGEFSIGLNPHIHKPINNTLFDEKICGSIHFTPGHCYDDAPNGNESAVHWDIVLLQEKEFGGGELWFDNVLVRKDGRFVLPELKLLNPENLIS